MEHGRPSPAAALSSPTRSSPPVLHGVHHDSTAAIRDAGAVSPVADLKTGHGINRMKPSASCWRPVKVAPFRGSGLPVSRAFGRTGRSALKSAAPLRFRARPFLQSSTQPPGVRLRREFPPWRSGQGSGAGHELPAGPAQRGASGAGAAGWAPAGSGRTGGTRSTWTPQPLVHAAGADVRRSRAGRLPPPESDPEGSFMDRTAGDLFQRPGQPPGGQAHSSRTSVRHRSS